MKLGVVQEGDNFFFHIETKDPVTISFNAEKGHHELTIGPFSREKYQDYTGLTELPKQPEEVTVETEPSTQKLMSDLVQKEPVKDNDPVLNWDSETDFTPAAPVNPEMLEKAKEAIADIDTTEAVKELDNIVEAHKAKTPYVPKTFKELEEGARANIIALDKSLEEGGRVNVADKYILNCQADLNQLVPFKYGWAWSNYLNACDKHWMPPEFNLESVAISFNDGTFKASHKAIITKAWYTDQYHQLLLPIQTVLNCYRLITNPECRQYTLRQAFEHSLKKHAWLHLTETLVEEGKTFATHVIDSKGTKSSASLYLIDSTLRDRFSLVKANLTNITGETFSTEGIDNIRTFVFELLVGFGYVNYVMLLPAYYQVMNLNRIGLPCGSLTNVFEMLVKDIKAQTENLKLLISSIIEENPGVLNTELQSKASDFFNKTFDLETDIISLCSTSEQDFASISHLLAGEINALLATIGASLPEKRLPQHPDHAWFLEVLAKHSPAVNHVTTVTGTGGTLEF